HLSPRCPTRRSSDLPADVRVDLELALHAVDDDLQVQLAHAGDDGLAGLRVRVYAERRVLLRKLLERGREPVLVRLRLRLDRDVRSEEHTSELQSREN